MPKNTDPAQAAPVAGTIQNDSRLFAGAGAIAAFAAQRAGFSEKMQQDASAAAVEACRETFLAMGDAGGAPATSLSLEFRVAGFADRIEMTIESSGGAPQSAKYQEELSRRLESALAARVQCETRDGRLHLSLVKPFGAGAKA